MITGWGTEMSQRQIEEYGLDFFISKPFDFNQILNVVAETMESRGKRFLSSFFIQALPNLNFSF